MAIAGFLPSCRQAINAGGNAPKASATQIPAAPAAPQGPSAVPSVVASAAPRNVSADLTTYGVLRTPAQDYVNPMLTGRQTYEWCVCRNIGTSPHIGWDLGFTGSNRSIALANGIVKSVNLVSGACGYEVILEDTGGARWRYLHLNKPTVQEGQVLFQGALVGTHQNYPTSACGSGPHLHLERHSAGAFGDSEKLKSCEGGPETCHFDAKTPLAGKRFLGSTSEAASLQEKNRSATEAAKKGGAYADSSGATALSLADSQENPLVLLDPKPFPCAFNQPDATPVREVPAVTDSDDSPDTRDGGVTMNVGASARSGGLPALVTFEARASDARDGNACARGPCVAAWTLYARTPRGWMRVLEDSGTRDVPVAVVAEQKLCWPVDHDGAWRAELQVETAGHLERRLREGKTR